MPPASATRPVAFINALLDSTWPLAIPIEMVAPPHAAFAEAIWTFHAPSNVEAATGVATTVPSSIRMRVATNVLQKYPMTCSLGSGAINLSDRFVGDCERNHMRR